MALHSAPRLQARAGPAARRPVRRANPAPFCAHAASRSAQRTNVAAQRSAHAAVSPALAWQQQQRHWRLPGAGGRQALAAPPAAAAAAGGANDSGRLALPDGSVSVVLLAGGVGKRMGAAIPKQYLELRGQAIATYSLSTFAAMREVGEVVIVCDPSWRHVFESRLGGLPPHVAIKWALPGAERQDSVSNGLAQVRLRCRVVRLHGGSGVGAALWLGCAFDVRGASRSLCAARCLLWQHACAHAHSDMLTHPMYHCRTHARRWMLARWWSRCTTRRGRW